MARAGNAKLMTPELVATVAEHAGGSLRAMMLMSDELLEVGAEREVKQLDEKLYLEVFAVPPSAEQVKAKRERGGRRR